MREKPGLAGGGSRNFRLLRRYYWPAGISSGIGMSCGAAGSGAVSDWGRDLGKAGSSWGLTPGISP
ncbi:MAG: hypothetical protein ACK48Y_24265, partial [Planctomyces sp.]